jgi:hypothetical protein
MGNQRATAPQLPSRRRSRTPKTQPFRCPVSLPRLAASRFPKAKVVRSNRIGGAMPAEPASVPATMSGLRADPSAVRGEACDDGRPRDAGSNRIGGAPYKTAKNNTNTSCFRCFAWCGTARSAARYGTECDAEGRRATRGVAIAWKRLDRRTGAKSAARRRARKVFLLSCGVGASSCSAFPKKAGRRQATRS